MFEFIKVLFKLVKVENSMRTQVYIILLNYIKKLRYALLQHINNFVQKYILQKNPYRMILRSTYTIRLCRAK